MSKTLNNLTKEQMIKLSNLGEDFFLTTTDAYGEDNTSNYIGGFLVQDYGEVWHCGKTLVLPKVEGSSFSVEIREDFDEDLLS